MCYNRWKVSWKLLSNSGMKNFLCPFVSCTKHYFQGNKMSCSKTIVLQYFKKKMNWKLISPWKVINWDVLQIAKAHSRYTIWLMSSEKSSTRCTYLRGASVAQKVSTRRTINYALEFIIFSALELPLCGLMVFIVMKTYMLTESENFKLFLKENYQIALDIC